MKMPTIKLKKVSESKENSVVVGARNIKKELNAYFPGIKFSVTSDFFSMGCAIDINWTDGPTRKEVEEITDKYEYGTFDSMTDSTGFKNKEFTEIYGGAKFVQTNRRELEKLPLLVCNCCGKYTHGRQWWNRDRGYGLCKNCVDSQLKRNEKRENIEFANGKIGFNCGID